MNQPETQTTQVMQKRKVDDYSVLQEGDVDPSTGKRIEKLILNSTYFIVYLDNKLRIQWEVTDEYQDKIGYSGLFEEVISRVTELEGLSQTADLPPRQLREYRTLLGTSIALMLNGGKEGTKREIIKKTIDRADVYLRDRMTEKARGWYLVSSAIVTGIALIFVLLLGIFKSQVDQFFGAATFDVLFGTFMGAVGALISIVIRLTREDKIKLNASAGKKTHYLEGTARIVMGMLGGLLVGLAIKGGIFLTIIDATKANFSALIAVCTVAGASERMVPSLIKQVEGMAEEEKKTGQTSEGKGDKTDSAGTGTAKTGEQAEEAKK